MDGKEGTLTKCYLNYDAWLTCSAHAFSTEKQEVMGLLLGRWVEDGTVAIVDSALVLARSDRKKDRVEVGYEQLASASEMAEAREKRIGRECRVIGWYHSHPHITVQPSHVDVRTQGQYQAMDPAFLGLIFSCFSQDSTSHINRVEVTAFQAAGSHLKSNDNELPSSCTCSDENNSISDSIACAVLSGAHLNQPGSFGVQKRKRFIPCPVNNLPLHWRHREVSLEVCRYPDDSLKTSSNFDHTDFQREPQIPVSSATLTAPPTASNLVVSTPVMLTPDPLTSPRSIPPASSIRTVTAKTTVDPSMMTNTATPLVVAASSPTRSPTSPLLSPLVERTKPVDKCDVSFLSTSDSLQGLVRLLQVLMDEERASYMRSVVGIDEESQPIKTDSKVNALHVLHNSAIYQKSLCNTLEELVRPVDVLIDKAAKRCEVERCELEAENLRLKATLAKQNFKQSIASAQSCPSAPLCITDDLIDLTPPTQEG